MLTYEHFGTWTFGIGLKDERPTRILSRRRQNLLGREISVGMIITRNDPVKHSADFQYVNL